MLQKYKKDKMNWNLTWKEIYRRQKRIEIFWTGVIIIISIIGVVAEVYVHCGRAIWEIDDLDTLSLTVLQIQTTIDTLTIALLALLGNHITDSYMDVNLNDYQLNRKPIWFKEKRIIYGSLILLVFNIVAHMTGCYNLVMAVFMIVCILIGISVRQIYEAFTKDIYIKKEIKAYQTWNILENKVLDQMYSYVNAWKAEIRKQSVLEYEEWLEVFRMSFAQEFLKEYTGARRGLCDLCSELIRILLKSEREITKKRGMQLLNICYEDACKLIWDNPEKVKCFDDGFHLFDNITQELKGAMEDMPIKMVESVLSWNFLSEMILRVNYGIAYRDTKNQPDYELIQVTEFSSYCAYYLSRKRDEEYNPKEWTELLLHLKYYNENDYVVNKDVVNKQRADMMKGFAVGLIRFQMSDILKNTLYRQAMRYSNVINSKYYVYAVLDIHCYIYYIARYESTRCVSEELKKSCISFLEDGEIIGAFSRFLCALDYIDSEDENSVFNKNLEEEIWNGIKRYEFMPKYDNGKQLILNTVVRNFVTFIVLYMERKYYMPDLLERTIPDEEILTYYLEFVGKEDKKEKLVDFLGMLGNTKENVEEEAENMLLRLERFVVLKYKEQQINCASNMQKEYEKNVDESKVKNDISNKLKSYLSEKFALIISDVKNGKRLQRLELHYIFFDFTNTHLERCIDGFYDNLADRVIRNLTKVLEKNGVVERQDRNMFSDEEYIRWLETYNSVVILGSEYAFEAKSYQNREKLNEYLMNHDYIFAGFTNKLLVLSKKVNMEIKDIKILIRPGKMEDEDITKMSDGRYSYEIMDGMPAEFTENELEEFLYNRRKVIEVDIKIELMIPEENMGVILVRN